MTFTTRGLGRRQRPTKHRRRKRVGGVGVEHDVGVVLDPAAGEHRVEHLAVLGAGDDAVDDVGGDALSGVDGGGVAELDVLAHVVSRQGRV